MSAPRRLSGLQARGIVLRVLHNLASPAFYSSNIHFEPSCFLAQKQVLSLARSVVRASRTKPEEMRAGVLAQLRLEFEKGKAVDRTDIMLIEHLLRRGAKHLALLRSDTFSGVTWIKPPAATTG